MAEAFGVGSGVVGVVSLGLQLSGMIHKFGLDFKDAPEEVKRILLELSTIQTILLEVQNSIISNQDLGSAFSGAHRSALLTHLDPTSNSDGARMLQEYGKELIKVIAELKKMSDKGAKRMGWSRIKTAFLSPQTQEAVGVFHRQLQLLSNISTFDSLVLGARTNNELKVVSKLGTSTNDELKVVSRRQVDHYANKKQLRILDWLTQNSVSYGVQHSDFLERRLPGTGQWLFEMEEFKRWHDGEIRTLLCHGIPGAGKTMITCLTIDHLTTMYELEDDVAIAYIYCSFQRKSEQRLANLLASLVRQLSDQVNGPFCTGLEILYNRHARKKTRPTVSELSSLLEELVGRFKKTIFIIDALDECLDNHGSARREILSEIRRLEADHSSVYFFATSRNIPDVLAEFEKTTFLSLEIRATDQDIERFLDAKMPDLRSFVHRQPKLKDEIKARIVKAVEGMFLLAQLYMEALADKMSPKALRSTLTAFEKTAEGDVSSKRTRQLDDAYTEAMNRIRAQSTGLLELAELVLSWIVCAKSPLTALELKTALAVEVGESFVDEENFTDIEDMITACNGLVTHEEGSGTMRLVHYTAQEYLEREQRSWLPQAQIVLSMTCLSYLQFDLYPNSSTLPDWTEYDKRLNRMRDGTFPLYQYAVRNWGYHVREAWEEAKDLVLQFLLQKKQLQLARDCLADLAFFWSRSMVRPYTTCEPQYSLAIHFGIKQLVLHLQENQEREPEGKSTSFTLLHAAVRQNSETIVELLLDSSTIDPNAMDEHGRTAFSYAAEAGYVNIMGIFLKRNVVDLSLREGVDAETPLLMACRKSRPEAVKLLLSQNGVDILATAANGHTALSYAVREGKGRQRGTEIVRMLLEWDEIDPTSQLRIVDDGTVTTSDLEKSNAAETVLTLAASRGRDDLIRIFLSDRRKIDPNFQDPTTGRTMLHFAAGVQRLPVVKTLLSYPQIQVDIKDKAGRTPLSWMAAGYVVRDEDILRMLLAHSDVDPDSKDIYGRTPLSWAAGDGAPDFVLEFLLADDRVDPNSKDSTGRSPLSWAASGVDDSGDSENPIEFLLQDPRINVNLPDTEGRTPLAWAVRNGRIHRTKCLLQHAEIDPNIADNSGLTPLFIAVTNGILTGSQMVERYVEALLDHPEIQSGLQDANGRSPFSWYVTSPETDLAQANDIVLTIEQFFCTNKTNVNSQDDSGRTPLSYAIEFGISAAVSWLLHCPTVDIHLPDKEGKSPKDYAVARGDEEILEMVTSRLDASRLEVWTEANPDIPGVGGWMWKFTEGFKWNGWLDEGVEREPEVILLSDGRDLEEEVRKVPVQPCVA